MSQEWRDLEALFQQYDREIHRANYGHMNPTAQEWATGQHQNPLAEEWYTGERINPVAREWATGQRVWYGYPVDDRR